MLATVSLSFALSSRSGPFTLVPSVVPPQGAGIATLTADDQQLTTKGTIFETDSNILPLSQLLCNADHMALNMTHLNGIEHRWQVPTRTEKKFFATVEKPL